ncbi:phosphate ABC transporter permease subunit PstC [Bremerella sp. T1]|uniref:phosphate ABC transporter permease subunit PstC n=1 Tax=Bremerella sp. TYQ1 TaxID=3119568 RepID=UPI001CCDBCA4|nr:phosphate ABC transporter permease subunit PstC [Bremerella volcania]UBM38330.1 phosphate ABC transporter permease subunit PstC [Bremerella volcania]
MSRPLADRWLSFTTSAAAFVAGSVVLLVLTFLLQEAWPALSRIGLTRFVTDDGWYPSSDRFNFLPMLTATLLTTAGAVAIAAPLGIGSAIFSQFYAPAMLSAWYRRLVQLLAGIPSVVYGLWGLVVLVPIMAQLGGTGQGLLTATTVLALMILPTVALTAEVALAAVPPEQLQGAAALGLGRWAIAKGVAMPSARRGIGAGVMLATARALGETMAVLMVAGNVVAMPTSLTGPVRTLTANIASEMAYASADHRSVLFVSGLLLMAAVGVIVLGVEWLRRRHDA